MRLPLPYAKVPYKHLWCRSCNILSTCHSLAELQLSRNKGLTVLAIKPEGEHGAMPRPDQPLGKDDVLVVGGDKKKIDAIEHG